MGVVLIAAFGVPVGFWLVSLDPTLVSTGLDAKEWIALYAVLAAILGWLLAAAVQIRNSLKQHTVNTMLQSRLSTAFQDKATKLNAAYPTLTGITPVKHNDWQSTDATIRDGVEAARYMLNYYEFIAVGIRSGDFDEKLMRHSWRKIVLNLHELAGELIKHLRGTRPDGAVDHPRVYEHFLWLVERWRNV